MNNEIRNRLQHALAHAARNGSVLESHVAVLKSDIRALLAAGASEGQAEPIYQVRPRNGEEWTDVSEAEYHISGGAGYLQRIVYLRPSAEIAALRERIAGSTAQDAQSGEDQK